MAAEAEIRIGVETENAERNIAAFQGAIDVLGGSLEVAVGGLALFGVSEEQIEGIESAALGAIAFADGSKRLSDGLVALAKNTNIAAKAQKAFNLAAKANPYILAGTAIVATIGAIAGAYALLSDSAEDATADLTGLNAAIEKLSGNEAALATLLGQLEQLSEQIFPDNDPLRKQYDEAAILYADLLELQTASQENELAIRKEVAEELNEVAQGQFKNFLNFEDDKLQARKEAYEKQLEEDEENEFARQALFAINAVESIRQEQDLQFQISEALAEALINREAAYIAYTHALKREAEGAGEDLEELETKAVTTLEVLGDTVERTLMTSTTNVGDMVDDTVGETMNRLEEYRFALIGFGEDAGNIIPEVAKMITEDLIAAASFASDLITIFEKDGEERARKQFELAKKVNISLAVINGAAAITEVIKDPSIPTTVGKIAAAVGIAATTAAQIATIQRQEFNAGGGDLDTPDDPSTSIAGELAEFTPFASEQIARQQATLGGTFGGQNTVKAFVVSGEVTSGQEADQQLQTRRTL